MNSTCAGSHRKANSTTSALSGPWPLITAKRRISSATSNSRLISPDSGKATGTRDDERGHQRAAVLLPACAGSLDSRDRSLVAALARANDPSASLCDHGD